MSILIKGMEMPKPGERLSIDIDSSGKVSINLDLQCRQIGTASQVPPHGRMVDAGGIASEIDKEIEKNDQLMALCGNAGDMRNYFNLSKVQIGLLSARHMVNNAPTIIPAEEGE